VEPLTTAALVGVIVIAVSWADGTVTVALPQIEPAHAFTVVVPAAVAYTVPEFVESLANSLNQTKSESERVLEAVVDVLKQALQRGEKIDLRSPGVFKVRESKPRQARNPRTGEALSIPAKKAAVFKPGKELSALLNTSAEEPDAQAKAVEQPV